MSDRYWLYISTAGVSLPSSFDSFPMSFDGVSGLCSASDTSSYRLHDTSQPTKPPHARQIQHAHTLGWVVGTGVSPRTSVLHRGQNRRRTTAWTRIVPAAPAQPQHMGNGCSGNAPAVRTDLHPQIENHACVPRQTRYDDPAWLQQQQQQQAAAVVVTTRQE